MDDKRVCGCGHPDCTECNPPLELDGYPDSALNRLGRLEDAVRWYIKHVQGCEGTDFLSSSYAGCDPSDEPHLSIIRRFREVQY